MGTSKYIQEPWRKKQFNVIRFLLRVAAGSSASALRPTGIQGYVIYQICVCHGGCKCPVPKDATCDKPVHHGVNQWKCSKPSVCCWGASWMPLSGSESPDFFLAWWRFHIKILWGYPHGSIPQSYQKKFGHAVDHQTSPQAQGDASADIYRLQELYPWQGPQVSPQDWCFSAFALGKV